MILAMSRWTAVVTGLVALSASAQQSPGFTAQMVHPASAPELGATRPDWLKAPASASAVDRLATPRARAQDLAILFNQACVKAKGDADAVAAWAEAHGYVLTSSISRSLTQNIVGSGQPISVYSRGPRDDSLMIATSRRPVQCMAVTTGDVDGKVLRSLMDQLADEWAVQRHGSKLSVSIDMPDNPRYRTITYRTVVGRELDKLSMASPVGVGHGVAVLKLLPAQSSPAE